MWEFLLIFSSFLIYYKSVSIYSKKKGYSNDFKSAVFTSGFCLLILNFSTFILSEIFIKVVSIEGINEQDFNRLIYWKNLMCYIVISYFISDLIFMSIKLDFILHHIAGIIYFIIDLNRPDLSVIWLILFGELTNPLMTVWRLSKKLNQKVNDELTPFFFIFFTMVRFVIGIGITFHSTWSYSKYDQNYWYKLLNWLVFIGFLIGNSIWFFKILDIYIKRFKIQNTKKITVV